MRMEPVVESARADDLYGPFMWEDVDMFERLVEVGRAVQLAAPACVGVSVAVPEHGITLTLVATEPDVARADDGSGIESTLSFPGPGPHHRAMGFELYGSDPTAFDGRHDELAEILGAGSGSAVTNGDLSFHSRGVARRAPGILRESTELAIVSVLLARARHVGPDEAEQLLRDAAERAELPLVDLLQVMRELPPGP